MFFDIYTIIMKKTLIIRDGRILLEESAEHQKLLSLKICVGTNIYKFDHLAWSQPCHRWETTQQIKITYLKGLPIELQLFYPSKSIPKVIGQARIDMGIFSSHLEEELKIALTYDGMIKGWLYCHIGVEGQGPYSIQNKYLYIHKISFHFLEDYQADYKLEIIQNTQPIYKKNFILAQTTKTLFPNIKNCIKYSDVIRISVFSPEQKFKTISFLVDTIKRGKTTYYETWLRNKYNNKAGDVKVQYFLENLFLENDRKVMSRKGIFPKHLSKMSTFMSSTSAETNEKRTQDVFSKQEFEKIQQMTENQSNKLIEQDLNIKKNTFKIRRKENKMSTKCNDPEIQITKNQNSMPCLKKKVTLSSKKIEKKEQFYFQVPFE